VPTPRQRRRRFRGDRYVAFDSAWSAAMRMVADEPARYTPSDRHGWPSGRTRAASVEDLYYQVRRNRPGCDRPA